MTFVGISECACLDFPGEPSREEAPKAIWLHGEAGLRRALELLLGYESEVLKSWLQRETPPWDRRGRYHGAVHVDGVHITGINAADGTNLYPRYYTRFPT